ncbi:hypothetical protein LEP1GSC111_1451, partial [Leptospira interrogans str. UT126]
MKRKVYVGMDVHKETIQIAYLTSNTKEMVKESFLRNRALGFGQVIVYYGY